MPSFFDFMARNFVKTRLVDGWQSPKTRPNLGIEIDRADAFFRSHPSLNPFDSGQGRDFDALCEMRRILSFTAKQLVDYYGSTEVLQELIPLRSVNERMDRLVESSYLLNRYGGMVAQTGLQLQTYPPERSPFAITGFVAERWRRYKVGPHTPLEYEVPPEETPDVVVEGLQIRFRSRVAVVSGGLDLGWVAPEKFVSSGTPRQPNVEMNNRWSFAEMHARLCQAFDQQVSPFDPVEEGRLSLLSLRVRGSSEFYRGYVMPEVFPLDEYEVTNRLRDRLRKHREVVLAWIVKEADGRSLQPVLRGARPKNRRKP